MAAANGRHEAGNIFGDLTSHSNPFMTLTAVRESQVELKTDYVSERDEHYGYFNPFLCEEELAEMRRGVTETPHKPAQPRFSSTNPFVGIDWDGYCFQDCVVNIQGEDPCSPVYNHQAHAQP